MGQEELVVGAGRVDAELVGIEEERRDRALVELLRLGGGSRTCSRQTATVPPSAGDEPDALASR
jgi:hypothetical protein